MDNLENEVTDVEDTSKNNEDDSPRMLGIFPTPVYFTNIGRSFTEEELTYMKELEDECRPNEGNTTSSNHYILQKPLMEDINNIITKEVNNFLKQLYAHTYPVEAYVTQSWLNYTKKGQWHHKHNHSNSFLSGVLYINASPLSDKIYFFNDEKPYIFKLTPGEYNMFNSESWWFPIKTGDIVIFRSDLTHAVETVETDDTRISLAFNTFLRGTIGHEDTLTGLKL